MRESNIISKTRPERTPIVSQEPRLPIKAPISAKGRIEIWLIKLDQIAPTACLRAILSPEERNRADKFLRPIDRSRFIFSRVAIKKILISYLDNPRPIDQDFSYGPWGKPYWDNLSFNFSHCQNLALLAVGGDSDPVGIDVENINSRDIDLSGVSVFFHPKEQILLRGFTAHERRKAFFRLWVRKEAVMKADGRGLSLGLERTLVSPFKEDNWGEIEEINGSVTKRWFTPTFAFGDFVAAAAMEKPRPLTFKNFDRELIEF
ncbi:MAG: 4'-phosphopantetheinyl transferase superfamily protein [Deltaproteobacteria bacterium]|jgi:4'-phosphopantetheinyl transferase|nr:4'-phosphopantetheinyl transferase superfamily protein [Deltaproteobacteria bacterium]